MASRVDGLSEPAAAAREFQRSSNSETPRTIRTDGGKGPVTVLRTRIGKEMDQEFITCPFNTFMESYLPFVPKQHDIDTCLQRMHDAKKSGKGGDPVVTKDLSKDSFCFGAFTDRTLTTELAYYANLEDIAAGIECQQVEGRQLSYKFYDCPTRRILSGIHGSNNQIDGCFASVNCDIGASFLHTAVIAVAGEWKIRDTPADRRKNNCQIVSANVQIMNDDARRVFSFGITIVSNMLRLWYFSRSHSAVSEEVDFVENPNALIAVFMSFMFANDEEMGYDPKVIRHPNETFTYDLSGRFFRTTGSISEYRSNSITGRMTRVWSVDEVEAAAENANVIPNRRFVLKDVWLEETAQTEKEIQLAIFKDIEQFRDTPPTNGKGDPFKKLRASLAEDFKGSRYKSYFLNIDIDYIGLRTKEVVGVGVGTVKLRGLFDKLAVPVSIPAHPTTRSTGGPTRTMDSPDYKKSMERSYARKKQYRIVFTEQCEAVQYLKTLGQVFDVVKMTLTPLQLMFCAGWVHRDISSGNILAYRANPDDPWTAKLSDLEYAKRFPPTDNYEASKDPKTGTPYFMANEILAGSPLFAEVVPVSSESEDEDEPEHVDGPDGSSEPTNLDGQDSIEPANILEGQDDSSTDNPDGWATATSNLPVKPPVIHNFQHDLESIWWLLLWAMTARMPHDLSQAYGKTIFTNIVTLTPERHTAFCFPIQEVLMKVVIPSAAVEISTFLENTRLYLHAHCVNREMKKNVFNTGSYVQVHRKIAGCCDKLSSLINKAWRDIELVPLPSNNDNADNSPKTEKVEAPAPSAPTKAKRPRGSDGYVPPLELTQGASEEGHVSARPKRARP